MQSVCTVWQVPEEMFYRSCTAGDAFGCRVTVGHPVVCTEGGAVHSSAPVNTKKNKAGVTKEENNGFKKNILMLIAVEINHHNFKKAPSPSILV